LEGDSVEVEDDTDRFSHHRRSSLEQYIEDREWDILQEPDYSEIREK